MVPSPEDEDRRRLCREREALVTERIRHTNRIMLAGQGIPDFDPLRPTHRARLDELKTGDGRPLPPCLLIRRQLGRLDAVVSPRSKPSAMAWLASARWIGPRRVRRSELSPTVCRRRSPLQWLKKSTLQWRRKKPRPVQPRRQRLPM
jgi:hypothetical protein